MPRFLATLTVLSLLATTAVADKREWTDSTGKYSVEGEMIAFTADTVVLKKENKELVAVPVAKLSKKDQEYLLSKEAEESARAAADKKQTWTMRTGVKVIARVVGYARKDLVIQRRRGKVYVNDQPFDNLDEIRQHMVPKIVAHFEKLPSDDRKTFETWVEKQKANARKFTCEGVLLELENGDEYGVPFFFFSDEDLKVLRPGWDRWAAADNDRKKQEEHEFMLQAQAQAYQQDRMVNQQISMMQLEMQAYGAGMFDYWQVALAPGRGVTGHPMVVVVPARNSQQALMTAMQRYPGYVSSGPIAKVQRKY